MKRNWLRYVAVVAALVAGSICSTAFAGPPSFKFGGGGGGSNNNNSNNGASNVTRSRIGSLQLQSGNGNSNNNQPRIGTFGGNAGQAMGGNIQTQIKKFPGNLNGNIGQAIGGGSNNNSPRVTIVPGGNVINQIKKSGNVGGIPGIVGNGQSIPQAVLGGNAIPKIGKSGNGNVAGQIVGNILGGGNGNGNGNAQASIQCGPIKVGCKPWWSDCHHHFHDHCYKPTYPVCSHTIVVQVPVEQITVVQPAMQVPVGSTLTLQSLGLGEAAGQVMLQVDKIAIPAMVNEWKPDAVTTTLPMLGLGAPVIADIVIVRADGTVANSIKVELINAQPQTAAAAGTGAVQPAAFQADQGGAAAALGGM